jgi:hypothetical protein
MQADETARDQHGGDPVADRDPGQEPGVAERHEVGRHFPDHRAQHQRQRQDQREAGAADHDDDADRARLPERAGLAHLIAAVEQGAERLDAARRRPEREHDAERQQAAVLLGQHVAQDRRQHLRHLRRRELE